MKSKRNSLQSGVNAARWRFGEVGLGFSENRCFGKAGAPNRYSGRSVPSGLKSLLMEPAGSEQTSL